MRPVDATILRFTTAKATAFREVQRHFFRMALQQVGKPCVAAAFQQQRSFAENIQSRVVGQDWNAVLREQIAGIGLLSMRCRLTPVSVSP